MCVCCCCCWLVATDKEEDEPLSFDSAGVLSVESTATATVE